MDDLVDRLRESFESMHQVVDFLRTPPGYIEELTGTREVTEEDVDRMLREAERDYEENKRREREFYRRLAAHRDWIGEHGCTPLGSEVRINWLKEGF